MYFEYYFVPKQGNGQLDKQFSVVGDLFKNLSDLDLDFRPNINAHLHIPERYSSQSFILGFCLNQLIHNM